MNQYLIAEYQKMLLRPLMSDNKKRIEFQKRLPVYYLYFYNYGTNVTC